MNKQELIDKLKKLLEMPSEIEGSDFDHGHDYGIQRAIVLAEQLDEPKRPAVPRYVADFYESIKDDLEDGVYELCVNFYDCGRDDLDGKIKYWFNNEDNKPIETLVKMRLYGYERREYKVALKSNGFYLGIHQEDGRMQTVFTRNELAEYGFNNLDEYEVTEVDDE